ncbi:hypothetical protein DY000_02035373 [Brassica cretica]|uniref:Uncharacterized protein n=1 Tax=Brassica cretica TaxID=69181 RepID=A0ABQ7DL90_BRACR|nr:hypothetical protein DY000_02035373 [Brassica cretica]
MRSRSDSEEQFTLDTNYVPPDTTDFETQQVMARLPAIDENDDQRDGGDDGNKQGRKRKLISLVDSEEDSDVEITPTTQTRKPPRKTSFGTASQKPIRKPAPRSRKNKGPSTQSRKNKGPSTQSLKKKSKIQEEIPDFDDELVEDELDEDEAGLDDLENRQGSDVWKDFTVVEKPNGDLKALCNHYRNEYAWYSHSHGTNEEMDGDGEEENLPSFESFESIVDGEGEDEYVVEQHAVSRHILLLSFYVQPARRLVRDCGLGRYGIRTAFWRPQPARDGPA